MSQIRKTSWKGKAAGTKRGPDEGDWVMRQTISHPSGYQLTAYGVYPGVVDPGSQLGIYLIQMLIELKVYKPEEEVHLRVNPKFRCQKTIAAYWSGDE